MIKLVVVVEQNGKNTMLNYSVQFYTDRHMEQKTSTWNCFVFNETHVGLPPISEVKYATKVFSPVKWIDPDAGQVLSNVEHIDFLVLDVDNDVDMLTINRLVKDLERKNFLIHFTYSAKKSFIANKTLRIRVILPLSRPVSLVDWDKFWFKATGKFDYLKCDPQCSNANRSYLLPSVPDKDTQKWFYDVGWRWFGSGSSLNVDEILNG